MGAVMMSQQLINYYNSYSETEIVFTKEIIKTLHLDPRQVYIKCGGEHWPCILNSSSLLMAKIILGTKGGAYAALQAGASVSLRFCFTPPFAAPITFFVNAKVHDTTPYMDTADLVIVTLEYTQRAPDDLIAIIGSLLEANINAVKRREERIKVTSASKRRLGLEKEESLVFVQNIPRHCILCDVSFSGAKLILVGTKDFVYKKIIMLRFDFIEPRETVYVKGLVVAANNVEGRSDLVVASVLYDEKAVPMTYKMRINNYISSVRKSQLSQNLAPDADGNELAEPSEQGEN